MSRPNDYWAFCAVGGHTVPRSETTSRFNGSISFLVCNDCNPEGKVNQAVEAPLPQNIKINEKYGPAMNIETQDEADAYFLKLVEHTMEMWKHRGESAKTRHEAEALERNNLGYYAGYYGDETRERVERLFKTEHPIFGSIAKNGPPDPDAVLRRGILMGQQARERAGQ